MAPKTKETLTIQISDISDKTANVFLLGKSPFIYNALSEKNAKLLLLPPLKGKAVQRKGLKHNPIEEYRDSTYKYRDDEVFPTRFYFPVGAFKRCIATAALDIPGVRKTEVQRLCWIDGERVPIYGIPELYMTGVRTADQKRTPDIRTRAIIRHWCCQFTVHAVSPLISQTEVLKLLSVAGLICGVGDGRQEKGAFSYGQFTLTNPADPAFLSIMANGGRDAQDAALKDPGMWDDQTEELYTWFNEELARRSLTGVSDAGDAEDEGDEGAADAS